MGKTVKMKHESKGAEKTDGNKVDLLDALDNVAVSLMGPQAQLAVLQQVIMDSGEDLIHDDTGTPLSLVGTQEPYGPICEILPHFLSDIRIKLERINDYISNVRRMEVEAHE